MSPRVSVVVTNYNHGRFLERRILSVLDQTFRDFELLYLDDASTDDSAAVFACLSGDPRIRAHPNRENSGSPYRQINRGAALARGEYIWVAEADDWAEKEFLEVLVGVLDAHPRCGLAYCQSLVIDAEDRVVGSTGKQTRWLDPERWKHDFVNRGRDECHRYLVYANTIPNASAVLFRRSVFEQIGGADEGIGICGDWLTWARMLLVSDVAFVARPLNRYRRHRHTVRLHRRRSAESVVGAFRVLQLIDSELGLTDDEKEVVFERQTRAWLRNWLRLTGAMPLSDAREIHRLAGALDPKLHSRMLRHALARLWPFSPSTRRWSEKQRGWRGADAQSAPGPAGEDRSNQ